MHHVNFLQHDQRGVQHFSLPEYSENSGQCISITLSTHVETVVLLSHKKPDGHINVKVEFGAVSYTHLDVYKRQTIGGHIEYSGRSDIGDAYDSVLSMLCLLYTSRCV